jgi:hypothetical protein
MRAVLADPSLLLGALLSIAALKLFPGVREG